MGERLVDVGKLEYVLKVGELLDCFDRAFVACFLRTMTSISYNSFIVENGSGFNDLGLIEK